MYKNSTGPQKEKNTVTEKDQGFRGTVTVVPAERSELANAICKQYKCSHSAAEMVSAFLQLLCSCRLPPAYATR